MKVLKSSETESRRLRLNQNEVAAVLETLKGYLYDKSRKVRMFSLQALANLAADEAKLRPQVIAVLENVTKTGSSAMKTEGQKLLDNLRKL